MKCTLRFDPTGKVRGLYSELIDLKELGKLSIRRASTIEFDHQKQLWKVCDLEGRPLFEHASRSACLAWEEDNLDPAGE